MSNLISVSINEKEKVKVAKCKRKAIKGIIDVAPNYTLIEEIRICGSVLKETCKEDDIIELIVFGSVSISAFMATPDYCGFTTDLYRNSKDRYDVMYFSIHDNVIGYHDKGVCIYKRNIEQL